jgi:hypothetical protein
VRRSNEFFNVRPRYSPGSPAMVDERTAQRVANDEREMIASNLDGTYGAALQAKAWALGLAWIVESVGERAGGWDVLDLLTDERYRRPFKWKAGDRIDYFHPERGWVSGRVETKTDQHVVTITLDGEERWNVIEAPRERLRLTASVQKPEVAK